ncbi:hypothetical protein K7X08_032798 [Anisodus acutangulus]|uniref:Uncharacterized protein n=1 Tax=Anisodus acutangulus TaxID=402998 RepID=A0A9Q1RBK5_9SOLA|nr:hypothetical protein K7X08_032798 [Anisodus acutangulus]
MGRDVWRNSSALHLFFPKNEKYVPLFSGASGKDLEETGSEDDELHDLSDDGFFEGGSSSEDADDESTDKSAREQASSASGKAASSMSSD